MVSPEYLAGFIDGEGHLSLGKCPRRGRSTEYPVRVVVYNSNLELLTEIQRTWGGNLSDAGTRNPRWKPARALIWTNAAAAAVLARVAPSLRVKSRQAAELLNFHEHLRKVRRGRDRAGHLLPLSRRELRFRAAYHERLKHLNARGPSAGVPPQHIGTMHDPWSMEWRKPSVEYLAGFIDAEGALMIAKWKGRRSWNPQYRARISLSNTHRVALEEVQRAYGGILAHQPGREAAWKDAYQLVWTGGMVEQLLTVMAPILRLKREQAAVMMDFIRHQKNTQQGRQGRNGRFFAALPEEVIALREGLYRQMRELNARGPRALRRA